MMSHPDPIRWFEWGTDAFLSAAKEQKPVLLSIGAAWCRWTEEMDRISYRDPRVLQLVTERFVAIRVDADRRPDVSERYTLGGWPTTAFLTPDGDILGGGTYLDPGQLTKVLEQVADAFAIRRPEVDARVAEFRAGGTEASGSEWSAPPSHASEAWCWLDEQLVSCFDPDWAGFGTGPKRVEAEALAAAVLRCHETKNEETIRVVTETLDAIANGGLWDSVDGGFFRYCVERDWSNPQVEKILAVNAQLLELYLLASRLFTRPDYADRARSIILFVHSTFADAKGGFFASQRADPERAALSSRKERQQIGAPPVDNTVYTDATATMASAYVLGASVLEDDSLLEFAARSVDRVVTASYRPGQGIGHNVTGSPVPRGLLTDHVTMSAALLDLYEATGQPVYLDLPQELMAYCNRTMLNEEAGFADRARDLPPGLDAPLGLLREPRYPFVLNCRAAIVLARLGGYANEPAYMGLAERILAKQALVYRNHGLAGAVYLLALHGTARAAAMSEN